MKPDVVPVRGVLGRVVAEPDDEPALIGHVSGFSSRRHAASAGLLRLRGRLAPPPARGLRLAAASAEAPRSASICSAVGAAITCSTSICGSVARVTPRGSFRSPACTEAPTSMPSRSTSMDCGILVASASTGICTSCWSSRPPGLISPVNWIGISTVTFSPRLTISRSTCSRKPRSGSRCTALGRASSAPPGRPSSRISTFGVLSASIRSWPGSATCRGSVPWPYKDGRHLARATGAAGGAFAEFTARLGGDTYLGHGANSSSGTTDCSGR